MQASHPRLALNPLRDLIQRPAGQLPALDALRTLAIALVIGAHATGAYLRAGGTENLFSRLPFVRGGWIGVDLFFVLSGYFIGRQLWRELRQTGTIAFGRFAVRRGLRIWPLYFFFLGFVLLVLGRGGGPSLVGWSDVVFLTNYVNQGVVMGSWSLCTEEQFYILAPLLMIVGATRVKSLDGYRKYLVFLLVLLPAVRALTWWRLTGGFTHHEQALYYPHIYTPFHTHSDGLVMGLLLANLEAAGAGRFKTGAYASGWWVPLALLVWVGLQQVQREVFAFTGVTLVFGALVWYLLCKRPAWVGPLEHRAFYVLSRLSFGMYLNHEYLHEPTAAAARAALPAAVPAVAHNVVVAAVLFALSAAVSVVTFCAIEHPFLLLRERVLAARRPAAGAAPSPAPVPAVT